MACVLFIGNVPSEKLKGEIKKTLKLFSEPNIHMTFADPYTKDARAVAEIIKTTGNSASVFVDKSIKGLIPGIKNALNGPAFHIADTENDEIIPSSKATSSSLN